MVHAYLFTMCTLNNNIKIKLGYTQSHPLVGKIKENRTYLMEGWQGVLKWFPTLVIEVEIKHNLACFPS